MKRLFKIQHISYQWPDCELQSRLGYRGCKRTKTEGYWLITIGNTGAVLGLWLKWFRQDGLINTIKKCFKEQTIKKGKIMNVKNNDPEMERTLEPPKFLQRAQDGTRAEESAPKAEEDKKEEVTRK